MIPGRVFLPREIAELLNITSRQLHYWDESGLISPERTAGGHRRYSFREFVLLCVIMRLKVHCDCSIQVIRDILPVVRSKISLPGQNLSSKNIYIDIANKNNMHVLEEEPPPPGKYTMISVKDIELLSLISALR